MDELRYVAGGIAFAGAAFLAYHNRDGWGWLILAGFLVCS